MEYDGIVLESWSRWAAYGILHDPEMRNKVTIDLYEATFRAHFFEDLIFIKTFWNIVWLYIVLFFLVSY